MKPGDVRSPWASDLFTVRQYGDGGEIRVVHHKCRVRVAGWEPGRYRWVSPPERASVAGSGPDLAAWAKVYRMIPPATEPRRASGGPRLPSSLSRTRARVHELALCNRWDWFVTMTLDGQRWDRYALMAWRRSLSQWLRDYRKRTGARVAYLLIPERHQNGAWHIHGLLAGIPGEDVTPFTWADVRAGRCPAKLVQGGYWNWPRFAGKYGFCSLGRVRSQERVAGYVAKYITKDLVRVAADAGSNLYYCSQGLRRAEVIFRGQLEAVVPTVSWDWGDGNPAAWVRIKTYPDMMAFLAEWRLPEESACRDAWCQAAERERMAEPPVPEEGHWDGGSYHFSDCCLPPPRRIAGPFAGAGKECIRVEKRLYTASRVVTYSVLADRAEPACL